MSDEGRLIGYGKPPKHTQFKKGQSGNPKGRPPKQEQSFPGIMDALLQETIVGVKNGETIKMTTKEALARSLLNRGIKGDKKALDYLIGKELLNGLPLRPIVNITTTYVSPLPDENGVIPVVHVVET